MTQLQAIRNHLSNHKSITSWDAITEYGCTRLAAVICILRKEGMKIVSTDVTQKNRFGRYTTFTRYTLEDSNVDKE